MAISNPKENESKQEYLKRCTGELEVGGQSRAAAYAACNKTWSETRGRNQATALSLKAPLQLSKAKGEKEVRSFLITAYSGAPIERMFGPKVVLDVSGIASEARMPILREHMRDRVVGFGEKGWGDKSNFYVSGELSRATADGREIEKLADEGFPWQASVGVWPKKIKVLESEDEAETVNGQEIRGPAEIWKQSFVREVSFVALGADGNTAAVVFNQTAGEGSAAEVIEMKRQSVDASLVTRAREEAGRKGVPLVHELRRILRSEPHIADRLMEEIANFETETVLQGGQDMQTADQELADRARQLATEKKIPVFQAMREVLRRDPGLERRWQAETFGAGN